MKTHNNALQYYSTGNPLVEFFSKAGSLFTKSQSYYGNQASALDLFHNAWAMDRVKAFKLALWCRDARSGAGNRSGSREIFNFMATQDPSWVELNFDLIPKYGRWDDFSAFVGTPLEDSALKYWASAILNKDGLACKWAPREGKAQDALAKKIKQILNWSSKEYRKHLASNTTVVESKMCKRDWMDINYSHVPSVAMGRYGRAFLRHDDVGFSLYLEQVKSGSSKINTGAIYPHDTMRTLLAGQHELADSQFENMPNYFNTDMRVMPIIDTSGSMSISVSGAIRAYDVAVSLGFYCSSRLNPDNQFYKKFIPFSTKAEFFSWNDCDSFSSGVSKFRRTRGHGWWGSTNLESAFSLILETAAYFNLTAEQLPNVFLIISDMQFNQGVNSDSPLMDTILDRFTANGYEIPKVVYWNTAGYAGAPSNVFKNNTALVSGFSPAILNSVFTSEDFSPVAIMEKELEKYEIKLIE